MYAVPWPSRAVIDLVNSDYSNNAAYLKNCYLCFNTGRAEDSAYVMSSWGIKDCFDITEGGDTELSYQSQEIGNSYKTFFSFYCDKTSEVWFSRDCTGCTYCFGCVNLRGKHYYIFNKPYSKEEYFLKLKEFNLGSHESLSAISKTVQQIFLSHSYKYFHGTQNVNVSGDCLHNAKNTHYSYQVSDIEDSKYCQNTSLGTKDSYDYTTWGENAELVYEALETGNNCRNIKFAYGCWPANQDLEYSINCGSSSNLFGCVGLKKKSHCILNRQYTPQDYFNLREKIIRHMHEMPYKDSLGRIYKYGEFFPPEFSPYSYFETIAQDYLPLTKERAEQNGYRWIDAEAGNIKMTIKAIDLPDHIDMVDASVLDKIIECSSCKKAYRIINPELRFLKLNKIPLPHTCWECRHSERLSWVNPPRFCNRQCQCAGEKSERGIYKNSSSHFHGHEHCSNKFLTSFSPDKKEIIYCETCYQNEII